MPRSITITERYGVEQPIDGLRRLLVERLGESGADALLTEMRAIQTRYGRATRVAKAQRIVDTYDGREHELNRSQLRQLARARVLVEHAAAYVADGGFDVDDEGDDNV